MVICRVVLGVIFLAICESDITCRKADITEKSNCILAIAFFHGVDSGTRTHDIQCHKLTL